MDYSEYAEEYCETEPAKSICNFCRWRGKPECEHDGATDECDDFDE